MDKITITEADFDLIVSALKQKSATSNPYKNIPKEIIAMIVPEQHRAEVMKDLTIRTNREAEKSKQLTEETDLLIGKLLMLKRKLVDQDIMRDLNL